MTYKVGVALVHWNSGIVTMQCIESLLAAGVKEEWICLVDNASIDKQIEIVKNCRPKIRIIKNTVNRGFAAATNQALKQLLELEMEFYWILNNDTEVDKNCPIELVQSLEIDKKCAAISGKILYPGRTHIWFGGAIREKYWSLSKHDGKGKIDNGKFNTSLYVEFISGCCMLIPRSVLLDVGLLDESLFAYCEDNDWCLRARKKGYKLKYEPNCVILHHEAVSLSNNKSRTTKGKSSPTSIYLITRNNNILVMRYINSNMRKTVMLVVALGSNLPRLAAFIILGRWDKLIAYLKGYFDGIMQS